MRTAGPPLAIAVAAPVAVYQFGENQNECVQYVSTLSTPFVFKKPSGEEVFASRDDGRDFGNISDPIEAITIRMYEEDSPRAFRFIDPFGIAWQIVAE